MISTSEADKNDNIVCAIVIDGYTTLTNKKKFTTWHFRLHCAALSVIDSFWLYARQATISSG